MLRHLHRGPMGLIAVLTVLGLSSLVLSVVLMTGCAKQSSEATAGRRDITSYLPAEGTVVAPASARADVDSPYEVPVDKIFATVGQNVRRGETLVVFSAPQNQAYYDQARAALVQAQSALDQARKQYGDELRSAQKQLAVSRSTERKARVTSETGVSSAERQADEQAVIDAQARMAEVLVPYQQAVAAVQEQFKRGTGWRQIRSGHLTYHRHCSRGEC